VPSRHVMAVIRPASSLQGFLLAQHSSLLFLRSLNKQTSHAIQLAPLCTTHPNRTNSINDCSHSPVSSPWPPFFSQSCIDPPRLIGVLVRTAQGVPSWLPVQDPGVRYSSQLQRNISATAPSLLPLQETVAIIVMGTAAKATRTTTKSNHNQTVIFHDPIHVSAACAWTLCPALFHTVCLPEPILSTGSSFTL